MTAEEIAKALGGRRSGSGWSCCCPAHDDTNASFSVDDGDTAVVFYCHAGCEQDAVIDALRRKGLWDKPPSTARKKQATVLLDFNRRSEGQRGASPRSNGAGWPAG